MTAAYVFVAALFYDLAAWDAARVAADEDDRREVAEVQALLEALRKEG